MYNILVAEDDLDIIKILRLYLENDGMKVYEAHDGKAALTLLNENPIDLAILDIMMPKINGYELTKKLREKSNIPIVIISAKAEDSDVILGLNLGADDYITKPFNPLEVVARVQSNLRRFYSLNEAETENKGTVINVGNLRLDTVTCSLMKGSKKISLTSTEYKILQLLMKNPGRIFTKVQLYESAIGEYFESDENTIMVHISRLRDKVEDDVKNPEYIKTVRGLGYKIEKQESKS
ncbi:MAG: response regulator transcription factor [Lachnospiraceae bacterium]|nr:response regulator transcription factor [Lachnospiraceae bacterium]